VASPPRQAGEYRRTEMGVNSSVGNSPAASGFQEFDFEEIGDVMTTKQQYLDAARKLPKNRTTAEQALVDEAIKVGMQEVKNADLEARKHQKVYG
jgi:hypothetical protein